MSILSKIKFVDRYLGTPLNYLVYLLSKKTKSHLNKDKIKKILIIRMGFLGDVILSVPMLRELKRSFPKSKIYVFTSSKGGNLYNEVKYVDKVISMKFVEEKNFFYSAYINIKQVLKIIPLLRKENFDLIIDTEQYSRITPLISYFTNAPERIGFAPNFEKRGYLYTRKVDYSMDRYEKDSFLDLLEPLNINIKNRNLEFEVKKDRKIEKLFNEYNLNKKRIIIAVHPGSSPDRINKRWPKENFAKVINELLKRKDVGVIILGSEDEIQLAEEIKKISKRNPIILSGKTNFNQLIYTIKKSSVMVCNDAGLMHIASAVGTPIVAIISPKKYKKWGPRGKRDIIVREDLLEKEDKSDEFIHKEIIKPLDVISAVNKIIKEKR